MTVANAAGAELEPAVLEIQTRGTIEITVPVRSRLGTRAIGNERSVLKALRVAHSATESHDIGRR